MRVTIALLGFGLGAVMFAQTSLIYGLSNIMSDSESSSAAQAGLSMVVLWLFASAFVFGVPWVSFAMFVVAGAVGIANAANFPDLRIWGSASLILAGMVGFQLRQNHKEKAFSPAAQGTVATGTASCPGCGADNPASAKYCSTCGNALVHITCSVCRTRTTTGSAFCGNCGARLNAVTPAPQQASSHGAKRHTPLFVGILLFVFGQLMALGRSAGILGLGNLFGLVFLAGFLAWMIFWVRKNGPGGLHLPATILSKVTPSITPTATGTMAAERQFPYGLAVGILFIAGVVSFGIAAVDARFWSVRVDGPGMEPALPEGSLWTVSGDEYSSAVPQRGDLVLYADNGKQGQSVKRVIGLPGEQVTVSNSLVYINGVALNVPYIEDRTRCTRGTYCDVLLGDNELFVLGDNRVNSKDSRTEGPISLADVRGKIIKPFLQLGLR